MCNKPVPVNDGRSHINIYSKGRTELGRLLTNFAESPFFHPEYGRFKSVEGLWYWAMSGHNYQELRELSGFPAKRRGMEILRQQERHYSHENPIFRKIITDGIRAKLRDNHNILEKLIESTLPFEHYYWHGDLNDPKIKYLPQHDWMVDEITELRSIYQQES